MHSHAHLIIQTPEDLSASISNIMHDIAWRFALLYNRKHGRKGHFFNERFKSPLVEADVYGITLLRYIFQNPVRAGMVEKPRDWEFSSYRVYEEGAMDALVDFMPGYLGMSACRLRRAVLFRDLVESRSMKRDTGWSNNYAIGSESFIRKMLREHAPGPP